MLPGWDASMHWRIEFFAVTAILLFATPSLAACGAGDMSQRRDNALAIRDRLLQYSLGDGMVTDVSPQERRDIAAFKDRLTDLVDAVIRCARPGATIAEIGTELKAALPNPPLPAKSKLDFDGRYGSDLSFKVRRTGTLIGVVPTFSIECGSDGLLLIYRKDHSRALRWQRPAYDKVSGGLMAFDYAISAPAKDGRWLVGLKTVEPWCSSTWSDIEYTVLRPSLNGSTTSEVLRGADFMWWGNEDYGSIRIMNDSFDVRFHSASIDTGVHNRLWIRHFAIRGSNAVRTAPFADSPRDSMEEWIAAPWNIAIKFSSSQVVAHNRVLHDEMHKNPYSDYDSIRACTDGRQQIAIAAPAYFLVETKQPFRIDAVSKKPFAHCEGPDKMKY